MKFLKERERNRDQRYSRLPISDFRFEKFEFQEFEIRSTRPKSKVQQLHRIETVMINILTYL
jgi:hypothetical protein